MATSNRLPDNTVVADNVRFLVRDAFPGIMETSINSMAYLPVVNQYAGVLKPTVKPFMTALSGLTEREFVISGQGSLLDYDAIGQNIMRPTPHLAGTGCNAPSLCLENVCLGVTEGVIESANQIRSMCSSLSLGCIKDLMYSDRSFQKKIKQYFALHFTQPEAMLTAYIRTRLLQESIKVVATNKSIRYSGSVVGGATSIPLPFAINPVDARSFPDLGVLGVSVGGMNLEAFKKYLAPRLFSGSFSQAGMANVTYYGLSSSRDIAINQTASVLDNIGEKADKIAAASKFLPESSFVHDGLFPKFKGASEGFMPITAEVLVPSTIAGLIPEDNPEHNLALINGILAVPSTWKYELVEPPTDDFSSLGLGDILDFANSTPGVKRLMSSSMFSKNQLAPDGVIYLGKTMDSNGMIVNKSSGMQPRKAPIREAVRTEVLLTYQDTSGNDAIAGQYNNVGARIVSQKVAQGFELKSTIYVGSDIKGTARPVLFIFADDQPRAAKPIEVCDIVEVDDADESTAGIEIVNCCGGTMAFVTLTFSSADHGFEVDDQVIYRSGPRGHTERTIVTAVSGAVVTIHAIDDENELDTEAVLPCCAGSPDDYGSRGSLFLELGSTNKTASVFKVAPNSTTSIYLELLTSVPATLNNATGNLVLRDGQVVEVSTVGAQAGGVFLEVDLAGGEACTLAKLDCTCLLGAVLTLD